MQNNNNKHANIKSNIIIRFGFKLNPCSRMEGSSTTVCSVSLANTGSRFSSWSSFMSALPCAPLVMAERRSSKLPRLVASIRFRGNPRRSYLRSNLTASPGSELGNKRRLDPLWGARRTLQFTVNTPAGPPQRSQMSVGVWVWRAVVTVISWSLFAPHYDQWKGSYK